MMMRKQITLTKIVFASSWHSVLHIGFSKTHLLALRTRSIPRFKRLGQFSRNCGNSVISCASCFENPFSRSFLYTRTFSSWIPSFLPNFLPCFTPCSIPFSIPFSIPIFSSLSATSHILISIPPLCGGTNSDERFHFPLHCAIIVSRSYTTKHGRRSCRNLSRFKTAY